MAGVPYNRVSIISNAFVLLGKPSITSIASGGPVAADADQIYDQLLTAELSHPDWRFATSVSQLSQLAGVNPNYQGYSAAFQKPAGLLAIWNIYPMQPYNIFGDQIWTYGSSTNAGMIQVEYRELTSEARMPPVFLNYFVYVLAYNLGIGLTEHQNVLTRLEERMSTSRAIAMAVNSQERPNQAIQSSPWIANRGNGFNYWGGNGGLQNNSK